MIKLCPKLSRYYSFSLKWTIRLFILSSLCLKLGWAQQIPYKIYGVPDGMSQTQVLKVYHDSQGFIWAGTHSGINRFDGHRFENIRSSSGWYDGSIYGIIEDDHGDVFYTTSHGLVWHREMQGDTMVASELASAHIIGKDHTGKIWFRVHEDDGDPPTAILYSYHENKVERLISIDQTHFPGAKDYKVLQIAIEKGGDKICVAFIKGTFLNKENNLRNLDYIIYHIKADSSLEIVDEAYFSFQREHSSFLFTDASEENLFFFTDKEVVAYENGSWIPKWQLPSDGLGRSFSVDRKGRLIGIERTDEKNMILTLLIFEEGNIQRHALKSLFFNDIAIDHENNIWLGTEQGLIRIMGEAFTHFDMLNDSLPQSPWSVIKDDENNLWVASYGSGIQKFISGQFERDTLLNQYFGRTKDKYYMGAIKDHQSRLWFPNARGMAIYEEGNWSKLPTSKAVMSVYDDSSNQEVLFGALALYKWKDGQLIDSIPREKIGNKSYIVSINKDKTGAYWIGSHRNLIKYDGKEHFEEVAPNDSISLRGAISIHRDHRDNMWFGTHDGLMLFDYQNRLIPIGQDVYSRAINFIAQSDSNRLFLGLLEGLGVMDLTHFYQTGELKMDIYDSHSGFMGVECGQNGVFVDNQKDLWILTSDKLTHLEPDRLQTIQTSPKTSIASFDIQNIRGDESVWTRTTKEVLTYKEHNVRFRFRGIFYSKPDAVRYQYRLIGHDERWSEETPEALAEFTNLSPGDYTFEVRAKHSQSEWSEVKSQRFSIKPAFWQTWWFKLWAILLAIGSVAYISVWINEYLRRRKEAEIEKQGMISSLKLKTLTNQVNPHFAANLITILQSGVLKGETTQAMNLLARFGKLFRAVLLSNEDVFIALEQEIEFVKNYLSLEQARFKEKLQYRIEVAPDTPLNTLVPKMLIQTYVNNAIKHGLEHKKDNDWKLNIDIYRDTQHLFIEVQDNGVGRIAAEKYKIAHRSTGKGLKILEELFDWMNLNFEALSRHSITDLVDDADNPLGTHVKAQLPLLIDIPNLSKKT